jgi:uncharacterized membrane protein
MLTINNFIHWMTQNPLGAATMVYAAGICAVLLYAYFEPRDER